MPRDDSHLYIAFRCLEPNMAAVKPSPPKREGSVFADNHVEVFLAVTPDAAQYYHFAVNAAGDDYEAVGKDARWDGAWRCAAAKGTNPWTVEIAIPLASLEMREAASCGA